MVLLQIVAPTSFIVTYIPDNVYDTHNLKFYSIKIVWYKNYNISVVAIVAHEISIFKPLNENKCCFYRKNLNILYL
jgi:hypothetical protein